MLRLWTVGRLAAELDGVPVTMPTSERARALVGWLALHPGRQPRSEVAELLWPDLDPDRARASLRTALWAVHQAWGRAGAHLEATRSTVGLVAGGDADGDGEVWVDARDASAADLSGELLPGVEDEWVLVLRESHHQAVVAQLADRAQAAEDEGELAVAVRLSEEVCRIAPLDESAHRALLRRLLLAGNRASAVVAAREFSERLRSELGVRPSPPTRAAHAEARAGRAEEPRARLFGRSEELAQLVALWKAAAAGRGQVVVLSGEAGIGKSSLVAELAQRVGATGGRTSIGVGMDVAGRTPFAAWLELCTGLVASVPPVAAGATWPVELNRLSDGLGSRLGHPGAAPSVNAPELERLRVFEAVLRLVEWACADRPTMIALDDAHRADRASLRLTAHVGRRIARLPLLLVLTLRDGVPGPEVDAMVGDLAGRGVPVTQLALTPMTDSAVGALVQSLHPLGGEEVRRVVAAAEGNPLLAVESTRAVAAGAVGPPPNLRTAVRAASSRIPPAAAELVRLLAVAGRPLTPAELDRLELPEAAEAEDAATAEGLLVRRSGRLGFRHELLREAVYADLPNAPRLHDRIAAVVEPSRHADVAHHLTLAGRDSEAVRELAAAAAQARSMGALDEAREFLLRATRIAPHDGRLWLELEEVNAWAGRRSETEAAWEQVLTWLPEAELPAAWSRRGQQFRSVECNPDASLRAYQTAAALLGDLTPTATGDERALRGQVMVGLAWGDSVVGDGDAFERLLEEAGELLPGTPDPVTRADTVEIRMHGLIRQGRFAESVELALAETPGAVISRQPDRAFALLTNAACALTFLGDYERALEVAERAVEATSGVASVHVGALAARAHILARLERHEEAAETVGRERALADRLDAPGLAATAEHDAGLVALAAGRCAEAAELLDSALAGGASVSRPTAGLRCAEALALAGDAPAATARLRAAVLEPVTRADQPAALVPRIAYVQGLVAAAQGEDTLARRRFEESAAAWHRLLGSSASANADGYLANLVDLGRPPVVGLVEPARELERIQAALDDLRAPSALVTPET